MKKQLFDSFEEVVEAFGEDNLVVITFMPQIIFYLSNFNIQPVWTTPSEVNDNKLAFYFIKADFLFRNFEKSAPQHFRSVDLDSLSPYPNLCH